MATGGTDHDRLAALRSLAGLWLVSKGADLDAALRAWAVVLTVVDVRTLSTPLIDATLEHLATHLSVRCPRLPAAVVYFHHILSWYLHHILLALRVWWKYTTAYLRRYSRSMDLHH